MTVWKHVFFFTGSCFQNWLEIASVFKTLLKRLCCPLSFSSKYLLLHCLYCGKAALLACTGLWLLPAPHPVSTRRGPWTNGLWFCGQFKRREGSGQLPLGEGVASWLHTAKSEYPSSTGQTHELSWLPMRCHYVFFWTEGWEKGWDI